VFEIFAHFFMKGREFTLKHHINRNIKTPEDLGNAHIGSPNTAIVPPKRRIDRTEYGRRLAEAEGGIFTPSGYLVSMKKRRNRDNEE
jgi:hypothetical protein